MARADPDARILGHVSDQRPPERRGPPPDNGRPTLRQRLARAAIDISALRESSAFRRMISAQLASSIGTQVTLVALFLQVYDLTHSTFLVGIFDALAAVTSSFARSTGLHARP